MQNPELNPFSSLNDYFDNIYVLTLQGATERQKNVEKVLSGLDWQFFWGTDKNNLNMPELLEQGIYDDQLHCSTKRTHRSMNIGEIACSLSHKRIYQDMLEKGYQRALIMEDDVLPEFDRLHEFSRIIDQLPDDWEVLMLGYYGEKRPALASNIQRVVYLLCHTLKLFNWHKVSKNWINKMCLSDYSEDLYSIGKVLGTHSYAVNASAAEKFTKYQTPVCMQADRVFTYYGADNALNGFAPKRTLFTLSELSKVSSIQTRKRA